MVSLFNFTPVVTAHAFYRGKQNFMLPQDTYPAWVILAVETGEFEYALHNEEGISSFGDLVLCPPGTVLKRKALTTISYHFILFSWQSMNESNPHSYIPTGKIQIENKERLAENFVYMKSAEDLNESNRMKRVSQILNDIWYMYCQESSAGMRVSDKKIIDPLIEQATALINEQAFNRNLKLQDIAAELYLNPVQLTRRFFDAVGITPNHYLNTIRIQRVQSLLLESNLTLQQIAEDCGFENGFYLSRVFKKKLGISPSEFRKLNRF